LTKAKKSNEVLGPKESRTQKQPLPPDCVLIYTLFTKMCKEEELFFQDNC